jgi:hypothetical protein
VWSFRKRRFDADAVEINEFMHDDGAEQLRAALLRRDWGTAREILATDDPEHFMEYVSVAAHTEGVQEWIEGPIRDEPDSTLPLLIRGARAVSWAWDARGGGLGDTIPPDVVRVWFARLQLAEDCLAEVVERDPGNAEAWHYLVTLGRARQLPLEERWRRFHRLIEINPAHLYGHTQMLNNLMAKWSGSTEAMFDFARSRAAACPGTHVPVLIAQAHIEHRWRTGGREWLERDEVAAELHAAAHQSFWHDGYENSLVTPIVWNNFAYTLTYARHFKPAWNIYEAIGEDWVTNQPWGGVKWFLKGRAYAAENLDY